MIAKERKMLDAISRDAHKFRRTTNASINVNSNTLIDETKKLGNNIAEIKKYCDIISKVNGLEESIVIEDLTFNLGEYGLPRLINALREYVENTSNSLYDKVSNTTQQVLKFSGNSFRMVDMYTKLGDTKMTENALNQLVGSNDKEANEFNLLSLYYFNKKYKILQTGIDSFQKIYSNYGKKINAANKLATLGIDLSRGDYNTLATNISSSLAQKGAKALFPEMSKAGINNIGLTCSEIVGLTYSFINMGKDGNISFKDKKELTNKAYKSSSNVLIGIGATAAKGILLPVAAPGIGTTFVIAGTAASVSVISSETNKAIDDAIGNYNLKGSIIKADGTIPELDELITKKNNYEITASNGETYSVDKKTAVANDYKKLTSEEKGLIEEYYEIDDNLKEHKKAEIKYYSKNSLNTLTNSTSSNSTSSVSSVTSSVAGNLNGENENDYKMTADEFLSKYDENY